MALSQHSQSPHTSAFALGYVSLLRVFDGDLTDALELAPRQPELSREHDLGYRRVMGELAGRHGAEIQRLRGELALLEGDDAATRNRAAGYFDAARALAQRQGAKALELRAALSLAALLIASGEPALRTLEPLVPLRDSFGDGLQTADLRRATMWIE
jgi:hypothetical protein